MIKIQITMKQHLRPCLPPSPLTVRLSIEGPPPHHPPPTQHTYRHTAPIAVGRGGGGICGVQVPVCISSWMSISTQLTLNDLDNCHSLLYNLAILYIHLTCYICNY